MKRIGGLFEQITDYWTLRLAFLEVRRGKRFRQEVMQFQANLDAELAAIRKDIQTERFVFDGYRVFTVYEPKKRIICAAPVRERVVHHAIIRVCGDIMERSMIDNSYACRKGKGQLAAVSRAESYLRRYPWCLKLDISRYFDSISHALMMAQLERKFREQPLLRLWERLLASYETEPGKGLPIGNLTSQYLANLYLSPFDRFAGDVRQRGYVRYMDDMLVFGEHDDLKTLMHESAEFLGDQLELSIKQGGSLHRSDRGVDFLGYRLFPEKRLLNRRSCLRFRRRLQGLEKDFQRGTLTERELQERVTSLFAFAEHADTYHLRGTLLVDGHGQPRPARRELEQQRVERDVREP